MTGDEEKVSSLQKNIGFFGKELSCQHKRLKKKDWNQPP
jgi:hypothetical protein